MRTCLFLLVALSVLASPFVSSVALADPLRDAPSRSGPLQCRGPDPAAMPIGFTIVRHPAHPGDSAGVRITGTVTNLGTANYVSRPDQQTARLYLRGPGATWHLIAERPFQHLEVGDSFSFSYERNWTIGGPSTPTFKLAITYDAKIASDGNTSNDDCDLANNTRERSGVEIDAMLRDAPGP